MKVNEISTPFSDPAAYYVYKVMSVRQVPLSEVKTTITTTLQRQEYNDKMQQLQSAVTPVLNEAYFGPEPPANLPTNMIHHGMGPGGMQGMPPAGAGAPPAAGNGAPPPPPANNGTPSK